MHRRGFLKIAGRLSAGFGASVPLLGTLGSGSIVTASDKLAGRTQEASRSLRGLALPLDEGWLIGTDANNIGRDQRWFRGPQPGAKTTRVPSIIQQSFPAYHGVAWYWLEFNPDRHPLADGRYLLRFNAVDYLADVWLNGSYLGGHEGGETPFTFDVTNVIRPGQHNNLAVRVLNPDDKPIDGIVLAETPHRNKVVNFTSGNQYDFGGILEPVELLFKPAIRISDIYVKADWKTGLVRVQTSLQNASGRLLRGHLHLTFTDTSSGAVVSTDANVVDMPDREIEVHHQVSIDNHQLWQMDDPQLYQLSAMLESAEIDGHDHSSVQFGFRDFRITDGYFRLNGKRIFLKSTHTGNHTPFGQVIPPDGYADLLRRDMLYAKSSGFNTVRFIAGLARPYQLDLCDQLGLLVYEESSASWLLKDSPKMKVRYEASVREMILRDRNHPSVVIWGILNETEDGPVFREAEASLPLVRSFDETRLALLASGRFDGHLEIGSASNPGSSQWEHVWGKEAAGGGHVAMVYPSGPGSGDFHLYPTVPQTPETNNMMRTLGHGGKPVFLSEYGIGSMMDVIHEARMYEEAGIPKEAEDFIYILSMAERLSADWARFGMETVYPYPEVLLQISQKKMARHRLLGFNLIRSNPMICGFNLTGMLDHALTGEGVWRFWRDWKPGLFDAMRDGWAPVRWCLFVEPTHTYVGRPVTLEAVLANEDVLRPGDYPAQFRVWGPKGTAWDKKATISIPDDAKDSGPLAVPVMKEEAVIQGPPGTYELVPYIQKGIAPPETSWQFYLSDASSLPRIQRTILTWGVPRNVELWLESHGMSIVPLASAPTGSRDIILVGNVSSDQSAVHQWRRLAERSAMGATTVFLSPLAFSRDGDAASWLPLVNKGRIYKFHDWLYHKECVAKPHPVFEGLQADGILDWYYFGPVLPSYVFDGQNVPDEVMAVAFAAGYSTPGGYASGVLLGLYKFGAGQFVINSFPVLEHIDSHPVADRLLLNIVKHAANLSQGQTVALPPNFNALLREIGYTS